MRPYSDLCVNSRRANIFQSSRVLFKRIRMAGSWNIEETKALIAIWGQENVQSQLDRVHKNCDVYQHIAMELQDAGYVIKRLFRAQSLNEFLCLLRTSHDLRKSAALSCAF